LWDKGWTLSAISEVLLLNEKTIRRYRKFYEEEGLERLLNDDWRGSERRLAAIQERELQDHLKESIYATTKEVCEYVSKRYQVNYSYRSMQYVLKRLGFV
jgi:transposase